AEVVPGVAALAVILAYGPPLAFAQVAAYFFQGDGCSRASSSRTRSRSVRDRRVPAWSFPIQGTCPVARGATRTRKKPPGARVSRLPRSLCSAHSVETSRSVVACTLILTDARGLDSRFVPAGPLSGPAPPAPSRGCTGPGWAWAGRCRRFRRPGSRRGTVPS